MPSVTNTYLDHVCTLLQSQALFNMESWRNEPALLNATAQGCFQGDLKRNLDGTIATQDQQKAVQWLRDLVQPLTVDGAQWLNEFVEAVFSHFAAACADTELQSCEDDKYVLATVLFMAASQPKYHLLSWLCLARWQNLNNGWSGTEPHRLLGETLFGQTWTLLYAAAPLSSEEIVQHVWLDRPPFVFAPVVQTMPLPLPSTVTP